MPEIQVYQRNCRNPKRERPAIAKRRSSRRDVRRRTPSARVNERIRVPEIRVISETGEQLGIMPPAQALQIARERGLDLVEVAPSAKPPVCRILDFGKYQYEQAKRERQARKAQKTIEVKEVRLRPKTGEHDTEVRLKHSRKFLESGMKVKVRVRFRGREIYHPEVARAILADFADRLSDVSEIETRPNMEGRSLLMILAPLHGPK